MPKVSIIVPNYNHAPFLEKRFESVFNQTYQDFEVIYVDDASTDDSRLVFLNFAHDKRVKAIFNKVNSGSPFKQWNKGVRLAQGEYIWLAESDDYAEIQFLAKLVDVLDRNSMLGLAYCHSRYVDENNNIQEWSLGERWQQNFINNGRDECVRHLIYRNTITNASAVLIRKNVYEKAGYADEDMVFCGDWMMWTKMLFISDVAFVAEPMNNNRRHSGSVTSRYVKSLIYVEENYRVVNWIKEHMIVSKDSLNGVCEFLVSLWQDILWSKNIGVDWWHNRTIYRIASRVDDRLKRRFIRKAMPFILRKIGLLDVLMRTKRRMKFSSSCS